MYKSIDEQGQKGKNMHKTINKAVTYNKNTQRLAVNADTLAALLDCGRVTAVKIGTDAGAKIQIGRRTLYNVSIIERYLDNLSGE